MGIVLLIAGVVLGAALWNIVAHHRRENEDFAAQRWARENVEANAAAQASRDAEETRLHSLTDEELDAEIDAIEAADDEEAEKAFAAVQADVDAVSRL
jgi:hypothetical protein